MTRNRLLLAAALVVCGAAAVAVALSLGVLRPQDPATPVPTAESVAQQRCEADVMARLAAPDRAGLADVRTEQGSLDVDGRDMFSLTLEEPLKDVDRERITVLNVSGVINARNELGSIIQDHFDCRAYFVDGDLVHTLVVFDHNH